MIKFTPIPLIAAACPKELSTVSCSMPPGMPLSYVNSPNEIARCGASNTDGTHLYIIFLVSLTSVMF